MDEIFNKSIIVVAHPDDDILWFSSIFNKVSKILISYLNIKSNSKISLGRIQTLDSYPVKNVECLGIDESGVYNQACWSNPVLTDYGIKINNNKVAENRYIENYHKLSKKIENNIKDVRNVFTHNPWGEYGHEEHIQVYRVVKDLQAKYEYNIWFDNYCSNKSCNIMMNYTCGHEFTYHSMITNKELAIFIQKIYLKNGCWTWSDGFQWFDHESFISEVGDNSKMERFDKIFPVNLIKDREYMNQSNKQKSTGWFANLLSR